MSLGRGVWVAAVAVLAVGCSSGKGEAGSGTLSTTSSTTRVTTTTTTRPAANGTGFPGAGNTGVPDGTVLTAYGGPCTITVAGTVVDAKTIGCDLDIRAADVTIKRSRIDGQVGLDTDVAGSAQWSYTLADSEVNAGLRQYAAVSYGNMTVLRTEITGGGVSVQCGEHAVSCTVEDSWLHGQLIPPDATWHLGGFKSDGNTNIVLRHNTIVCDTKANANGEGGCTGDLNLLPDFGPVSHAVIEDNFLGASPDLAYCTYGGEGPSKPFPHADHVVYRNNTFQRGANGRCGAYGPVTAFNSAAPGNLWEENHWDDGAPVPPEN